MMEVRECSPPILKMSMEGPQESVVRGLGTPTNYLEVIDGRPPWEEMMEVLKRSPPIMKTSMAGPLGGDVGDPGVPTTYPKDFDGGPLGGDAEDLGASTTYLEDIDGKLPRRRSRRPGSAHHLP
jgi:hypothetical protein